MSPLMQRVTRVLARVASWIPDGPDGPEDFVMSTGWAKARDMFVLAAFTAVIWAVLFAVFMAAVMVFVLAVVVTRH
jgi:hypothetical protein